MIAVVGFAFKPADPGHKVGDTATDFKLKNVTGKTVLLADYKTAKDYIIFTCNHCPYAKAYAVVAIRPNDPVAEPIDSFENMQKLAKHKGYTYPYLIDETQDMTRAYGAKATPHVYVLQEAAAGNVVKYIGAIDNDTENGNPTKVKYLENAVNALFSNKQPGVSSTKAIGCGIKWRKSA